jgi:hypothetical protein
MYNPLLTPTEYHQQIRKILGTVSLDPCAHPEQKLRAQVYYYLSEGCDGLKEPWFGNVYCNPPWGHEPEYDFSAVLPWIQKAQVELLLCRTRSVLFLVPTAHVHLFPMAAVNVNFHEIQPQVSVFKSPKVIHNRPSWFSGPLEFGSPIYVTMAHMTLRGMKCIL